MRTLRGCPPPAAVARASSLPPTPAAAPRRRPARPADRPPRSRMGVRAGITAPTRCDLSIDSLRARATYWRMRALWNDGAPEDPSLFPSCRSMTTDRCIELGNGGRSIAEYLGLGSSYVATGAGGAGGGGDAKGGDRWRQCSGHGHCTMDWEECGAGGASEVATPCCSCDTGFAGVGCEQLDARTWVALAIALVAALLLLLMVACRVSSSLCGWPRRKGAPLEEPLLAGSSTMRMESRHYG